MIIKFNLNTPLAEKMNDVFFQFHGKNIHNMINAMYCITKTLDQPYAQLYLYSKYRHINALYFSIKFLLFVCPEKFSS